jgi:hypothetical protein
MTRVLLGALVVAMLTLTGLVTYHTVTSPDVPVPTAVAGDDSAGCPLHSAAACTAETAATCPACGGDAKVRSACCADEAAAKPNADGPAKTATAASEKPCCEDGPKADAGAKKD